MRSRFPFIVHLLVAVAILQGTARGQDGLSRYANQTLRLYLTGEYAEAEQYGERVTSYGINDANVAITVIKSELAQGKYDEAAESASAASKEYDGYIPMQVEAIETLRLCGRTEEAQTLLDGLDALAKELNPKNLNATELTGLGRAALLLGAEPKMVHAQFFQKARVAEPNNLTAALAAGKLAVDKGDYALASQMLGDARNKIGPIPDILFHLARAFSPSDREKADELIELALDRNPSHVPSILLRAEHAFDAEKYGEAKELLKTARETNPNHPEAWALESAIHYFNDETTDAEAARTKALKIWAKNPEIDFLIGRKLSQKRRFAEGSEFLRSALEFYPAHIGVRKILGQNLLRLGNESEGWTMLSEAQADDKYDVELFNLMLLHDELEKFETIEVEGFKVRMKPDEAAVYGQRVMVVLENAREILGKKYGFTPDAKTIVDFFPDQQDFAIRVLGMPGGLGIVGACFGNVIAMNSPGSPGAMGTNWESTLWHEYCHTITLGATRNRIPRWFTEGISVYEERQRDPACGFKMTPAHRDRILAADGLIPIADLSAALTAFNDPNTINFAYYQSSLLVEFMIDSFGESSIKRVLDDLSEDADIEKAIAKRMSSLTWIESEFAKYAQKRAGEYGPKADWEKPENEEILRRDPAGVADYLKKNPNNIWALMVHTNHLLADREWEKAKAPAKKLNSLYPQYIGPGNGYAALAKAFRNLEDHEAERDVLEQWAARDADADAAFLRLIELGLEEKDWALVQKNAQRQLALNPLLRDPHRALGIAAQEQGNAKDAIVAFDSLLALDPVNPADAHFRLAQLHRESDLARSKRHVLHAIEEAPRFRSAHRLLLELDATVTNSPSPELPDVTPNTETESPSE
ncbi:MAG: tetratricopeptide repeat protein [Verrucomicrobiota bacterium]